MRQDNPCANRAFEQMRGGSRNPDESIGLDMISVAGARRSATSNRTRDPNDYTVRLWDRR
jgi:hypothetical protein